MPFPPPPYAHLCLQHFHTFSHFPFSDFASFKSRLNVWPSYRLNISIGDAFGTSGSEYGRPVGAGFSLHRQPWTFLCCRPSKADFLCRPQTSSPRFPSKCKMQQQRVRDQLSTDEQQKLLLHPKLAKRHKYREGHGHHKAKDVAAVPVGSPTPSTVAISQHFSVSPTPAALPRFHLALVLLSLAVVAASVLCGLGCLVRQFQRRRTKQRRRRQRATEAVDAKEELERLARINQFIAREPPLADEQPQQGSKQPSHPIQIRVTISPPEATVETVETRTTAAEDQQKRTEEQQPELVGPEQFIQGILARVEEDWQGNGG